MNSENTLPPDFDGLFGHVLQLLARPPNTKAAMIVLVQDSGGVKIEAAGKPSADPEQTKQSVIAALRITADRLENVTAKREAGSEDESFSA